MTKDAILESVNKVFKDIFDDENIVINRSTTANDVDGWDSLTHITIISSVEEEFRIKFDMSDIVKFNNVGDMVDSIFVKLNK